MIAGECGGMGDGPREEGWQPQVTRRTDGEKRRRMWTLIGARDLLAVGTFHLSVLDRVIVRFGMSVQLLNTSRCEWYNI